MLLVFFLQMRGRLFDSDASVFDEAEAFGSAVPHVNVVVFSVDGAGGEKLVEAVQHRFAV